MSSTHHVVQGSVLVMSGIIERPSPNYDERRAPNGIDMLLLHYTGMRSAEAALQRLTDAEAQVSAHYTIDEDGRVYRHVPEERRAWHAGLSYWAGERDLNSCSIGIELVNPGHEFGYRPFPEAQMLSLIDLSKGILARHSIPAHRVLAHSDVAPGRKEDPGELFDWPRLARHGIGLCPAWDDVAVSGRTLQQLLTEIGFSMDSLWGETRVASKITAFQRHYRPADFSGKADAETLIRAEQVLLMAAQIAR